MKRKNVITFIHEKSIFITFENDTLVTFIKQYAKVLIHNSLFLFQIGSWKNITVLFLHSNKLETLPEEMGDMQKLKVINLSDNRFVTV